MGGSSSTTKTTNQTSQTAPYAAAQPLIDNLLAKMGGTNTALTGTENTALEALMGNAMGGNPFAGRIGGIADTLLGGGIDRTPMVNDAYAQYRSALEPTARGDFVNPESNPQLQSYLSMIGDDVQRRVGAAYSAAGRDPSGAGSYAASLGRGIAEGTAPVLYGAYSQARGEQLSAIDKLLGAGGSTAGLLSGLDQTRLGNQTAGIDASSAALGAKDSSFNQMLAIEAQRRGIPLQTMQALVGMGLPIASAFGTTNASGSETSETSTPLANQIIGGLIGGAGLIGQFGGFGPTGWLYGNPGAMLGGTKRA